MTQSWHATDEHVAAVAANVAEHESIAVEYAARTRRVATDPKLWNTWYFDQLRVALGELRTLFPDQPLRVLDACGGTGKTALVLQQHGVERVVLCDVSPAMTNVYREICEELGFTADVVVDDLAVYLSNPATPTFHLITFSSALHHLADYRGILDLAEGRLVPGGFIHTAWDPLPRTRLVERLLKVEYYVGRVAHPRSAVRGVARRLRRRRRRAAGWSASHEYHRSIDDRHVIDVARRLGLTVRIHHRNAGGYLRFTKPLWTALRAYTSFALLLQKPRADS